MPYRMHHTGWVWVSVAPAMTEGDIEMRWSINGWGRVSREISDRKPKMQRKMMSQDLQFMSKDVSHFQYWPIVMNEHDTFNTHDQHDFKQVAWSNKFQHQTSDVCFFVPSLTNGVTEVEKVLGLPRCCQATEVGRPMDCVNWCRKMLQQWSWHLNIQTQMALDESVGHVLPRYCEGWLGHVASSFLASDHTCQAGSQTGQAKS